MKKRTTKPPSETGDLLPHYDFDYSKGKRNPYARQMPGDTIAVVLEPDVASVFKTSDSVNSLLRSVITAVVPASATAPQHNDKRRRPNKGASFRPA